MKHLVNTTLILFWAAGTVLTAQPTTMRVGTSYGPMAVPSFLPPALDPTDPVGYWTNSLGLDAGQQASLKAILSDQQNSASALKSNLENARAALAAAVKANSSDSQIDQLSGDLAAAFAQAVAAQAKAAAKFYALLTADQKQKFDKLAAIPAGAGMVQVFGSGEGAGAVKQ